MIGSISASSNSPTKAKGFHLVNAFTSSSLILSLAMFFNKS
jgi:hypothetical protein